MTTEKSRSTSMRSWVVVLLATAVLIGAANISAYSATGGKFILGKTNKAGDISVLKRTTSGPALHLKTHASAPPMKVSSTKKVARLNADKVDGKNARQLQTHTRVYDVPVQTDTSGFSLALTGLPAGIYQASFNVIASMSTSGAFINCYFHPTGSFGEYTLLAYGAPRSGFSTTSVAGILDTRATTYDFTCFTSSGTATTDPASQVALTRVDTMAESNVGTLRIAPRRTAPPVN